MRFFLAHPVLIAIDLFIGVILFFGVDFWVKTLRGRKKIESLTSHKYIVFGEGILLVGLVIWGYLGSTAFYHIRDIGGVGDSYHYLSAALTTPGWYYNSQHMSYPTLPSFWIHGLESLGFLERHDPLYFERAMAFSTQPIRLLLVGALMMLLLTYRRLGYAWVEAIQATLLMAVSGACWTWAHQSNAVGIMIALQIGAFCSFLRWLKTSHLGYLIALAISLALCIYAQAATVYFVLPFYLYMSFLIWKKRGIYREKEWLIFSGVVSIFAGIYYDLAAKWSNSWNAHVIFSKIADTNFLGKFDPTIKGISVSFKDNLVNCLVNLAGIWEPHNFRDKVFIALSIIWLTVLSCFLAKDYRRIFLVLKSPAALLSVFCSLTIFCAFLIRDAGSRYFSVIAVPNIMLLSLVLIHQADALRRLLLQMLIGVLFLYSGFSTFNVFEIKNLDGNPAYRIHRSILKELKPEQKAVFYGYFDEKQQGDDGYHYRDAAIKGYYAETFNNIEWVWDPIIWQESRTLLAKIMVARGSNQAIYLSDAASTVLNVQTPSPDLKHIAVNLNRLNTT